jgi:hypothetical protein
MTIATGVAAIFINSPLGPNPGARDSNWGLDLVLCRTADGVIGMISGECALTERQTIPAHLLHETVKRWKRKTGEECAPLVHPANAES